MAKPISASEAAKAVNALHHFCTEDQEALLQVIDLVQVSKIKYIRSCW